MGRKSTITRLPDDVRAFIECQLAEGRLSLDALIEALQTRFPSQTHALPSRAAVHRYGQKLERRLSAIRASTEAAKIIRAQVGDKEDARSEALTAMIQSELFESIMELQEAGEEEMTQADRVGLLSKAAKNIATLTRSSVMLKQYQAKAEEEARKKLLAEQEANLQSVAKSQGMGAEQVEFWRKKVLGVS